MKLSRQGLRILCAFMEAPKSPLAGSDLAKRTLVGSGTLYPLLAKLEKGLLLTSEWETIDPRETKRPRKRLYTITGQGQNLVNETLSDLSKIGGMSWAR